MPGTFDPSTLLEAAMNGSLDLDTGAEHQPEQVTDEAAVDDKDSASADVSAPAGEDKGTQDLEQPAPIASKSGSYQIPYDKLVEARTERDTYRQRVADLEQQIQQLTAQQQSNLQQAQQAAQDRADAGQAATKADTNLAMAQAAMEQGVDIEAFGDFSEESIAKGLKQMVVSQVATQLEQELAPFRAQQAQSAKQSASEAHYNAIYKAHPDADEIVESTKWNEWLAGLPAFMRAATEQAMGQGTTEQIVEVFNTFKQQTAPTAGKPSVKSLIEQATVAPPNTLTDVPGAQAGQSSAEQLSIARDPSALMGMFEGKSPEEIERLMNMVV